MGLSYPPWNVAWLVWIGLVPVAWLLVSAPGNKAVYLGGCLAIFGFALTALDWLRTCYLPDGFIGPQTNSWLLIAEVVAVGSVASFWLGRQIALRARAPMMIGLPLFWVTGEYLRYHIGTLITGQPLPWLHVGLPLGTNLVLAQVADIGGVWMLSALVAFVNGWMFDCIAVFQRPISLKTKARRLAIYVISGVTIIGSVAAYGQWRLADRSSEVGPHVALMPGKVNPAPHGSSRHTSQLRGVDKSTGIDLILYPELSSQASIVYQSAGGRLKELPALSTVPSQVAKQSFLELARLVDATIMVGAGRIDEQAGQLHRYNSLACIAPESQSMTVYDKIYLVPFREYTPRGLGWFRARGHSGLTRGTTRIPFVVKGRSNGRSYQVAPAICCEVAFPSHFLHQSWRGNDARGGVDFFVCASDEPPNRLDGLQQILLLMTRLRAIESRRTIVRNVTNGCSGVVDGEGRVLYNVDLVPAGKAMSVGDIPISSTVSFYNTHGHRVPCAIAVATVLIALWYSDLPKKFGKRQMVM